MSKSQAGGGGCGSVCLAVGHQLQGGRFGWAPRGAGAPGASAEPLPHIAAGQGESLLHSSVLPSPALAGVGALRGPCGRLLLQAVPQELSGDGARKDVTSQAHVKVAIYKQVIARVTTQLSLRQRRVLLFISSPFARCSDVSPCPQTEPWCCGLPASTDFDTVPGFAASVGQLSSRDVGALQPEEGGSSVACVLGYPVQILHAEMSQHGASSSNDSCT